MKIDIITLHAVQNYGSVLQTFATQEIFRQYNCEVTVINYVRENVRPENLLKTWGKGNPIKNLVMLPTLARWKKIFGRFLKQYINLTSIIYTTDKDFELYPLNSDVYCTGSDQVWNSKWNRGVILPLYLSFVPEKKMKISFSASFGQLKIADDEVLITKKYIDQYNYISVREKSGKDILEGQYHYSEATQLIDPTLFMPAEFWRKHASPRKIKGEYILIYNLNRSKAFDRYATQLARRTGLTLMRFCTRYDQVLRPGKSLLIPEIFDFVSLIDHAKYVLTDSFHATAFSMNLNTEPICVYPKEFGDRLESFLQLTNSRQRHIQDFEDFDVVNRHVDFVKVNLVLDIERKKVDIFLNKVLSDAEKLKEQSINKFENL